MPAPAKFDDLKVFAFPTPGANNFVLRVRRDPSAAKYTRLAEGTDISECNFMQMRDTENEAYEGFLLTKIVPVVTEQQHVEDWFFVRPWTEQNDWNWTTKYLDESSEHPAVQRSCVLPRDDYEAQANGADADPVFDGYTLLSQEQVRHEDPVIDALFVVAVRTYAPLPGALRPGALKGDLQTAIPPEFRREIDVGIEMTKVPTGTAADTGADILESQVVPESVAMAEKRTYRISTEFPVELVESEITNERQVATVTKTLAEGPQSITPSATVSGKVENRGGGITIKTEVVVPEVFSRSQFSVERTEALPPKFRVAYPAETTQTDTAGTAAMPTLGTDDIAASSVQVDKFVKRDTVTVRDVTTGETLEGSQTSKEFGGTVAEVEESIVTDGSLADAGENVISSEVETLGNGQSVKRTVRRATADLEWPELHGQDLDEQLNVAIPYTLQVVDATTVPTATEEKTPLDRWRAQIKSVDLAAVKTALEDIHLVFEGQEEVSLPDVLTAVTVNESTQIGTGSVTEENHLFALKVVDGMTTSVQAASESSYSQTTQISHEITNGYQGPVPSKLHVFFMAMEDATLVNILSAVSATAWPAIRPKQYCITSKGFSTHTRNATTKQFMGVREMFFSGWALISKTDSVDEGRGSSISPHYIPPTIHGLITIGGAVEACSHTVLPATSPASFPAGVYLLPRGLDVQLYKHGFVKISAITVDVTGFV